MAKTLVTRADPTPGPHGRQRRVVQLIVALSLLIAILGPTAAPTIGPSAVGAQAGVTAPPASTAAPTPVIAPDIRFGAANAFHTPGRSTAAGVRWEPLIFAWNAIQPTAATDWVEPYPTQFLSDEMSRGRAPVGVIVGTPSWAARDPNEGTASVPSGLDVPFNDARNYWGNLVSRLVLRYKGLIRTWIIWDGLNSTTPQLWGGSVGDYAALLKVAYLSARASDPHAEVVIGALSYWPDHDAQRTPFLDNLLTSLALDPTAATNNSYFDGVALHTYGNPLDSFALPTMIKQTLRAHHIGTKSLWLTATGLAPTDDPANPLAAALNRGTLTDQASYVVQSYALALAAGLRRIGAATMQDDPPDANGNVYGLIRPDGSLRPAYFAYQTVTQLFANTTAALYSWHDNGSPPTDAEIAALLASAQTHDRWVWPAAVNRVQLLAPGRLVTVIWNAAPAAATAIVPGGGITTTLYTSLGTPVVPTPAPDGAVHLTLAPSTNNTDPRDRTLYMTGGAPQIVVQDGVTAIPTPVPQSPTPTGSPQSPTPVLSATVPVATVVPPPSPAVHLDSVSSILPPLAAGNGLTLTLRSGEVGPAAPVPPPTGSVLVTTTLLLLSPQVVTATSLVLPTAVATATSAPAVTTPTIPTGGGSLTAPAPLYFVATGHSLQGPFLSFYTAFDGATALGLPRTEARVEGNLLVQYFQNGRLQCRLPCATPAASTSYTTTVQVGPLGQSVVQRLPAFTSIARPDGWDNVMYVHATRHTLSGPFLDYWQSHNGTLWLGNPLSEPVTVMDRTGPQQPYLVQFFQRGALAYRPDPAGIKHSFVVQPAAIGDAVLLWRGWLRP